MSLISSFGYYRSSQQLTLERGLWNTQSQSGALARLEQQIMSQMRYQYGSDEPSSSSSALSILMTLQRKTQSVVNLTTTISYLSASDSTLSQLSTDLTNVKANGLEALNTTTSKTQRDALALEVKESLKSMMDRANTRFRDRYLFTGSVTTQQPFLWGNNSYTVKYVGNETNLNSWSDLEVLSQTNVNGADVFGAISAPVRGTEDLNPTLQSKTLLSDLHGGNGVSLGVLRLTYYDDQGNSQAADIDLSKCATIDDLRRTLAKNAPTGAVLNVELSNNGLRVGLSETSPGSLTVTEVGKGNTAHQLGIYSSAKIPSGTFLTGSDLNPVLSKNTNLDDLCGSKARTYLHFAGNDNDLIIQAKQNGETMLDPVTGESLDMNGIEIALFADIQVVPGEETAVYDPLTKRITVNIHPDMTTSHGIADAINTASQAGTIPPLEACHETVDQVKGNGTGLVPIAPGTPVVFGTTSGGSGVPFDRSGLQVVNDNTTFLLDFSESVTVGEMLNELNDQSVGLYAVINDTGNGIDVRTRVSGADFMIGENGGGTATQLGIRTLTGGTLLSTLDFNRGVEDYDGPGTNAAASYKSESPDSALLFTAKNEGSAYNDYKIEFVRTEDPDGRVLVSMDEENKTITVAVNPGVTLACEVVRAFNEQPGPRDLFNIALDESAGTNSGQGVVYEGKTVTGEGSDGGIDFQITRNDGVCMEIDIKGAKTIQDILDIINHHPDNTGSLLTAKLSENGNGIELADKSVGTGVTTVERALLSTAAISLGLVNEGEEYRTSTYAGVHAGVTLNSGAENTALMFSGECAGTYANDVKILFVDHVTAGDPNSTGFTWDAAGKILTFEIDEGVTTANDIIALFQQNAGDELRAMFDIQNAANADGSTSDGSGLIRVTPSDEVPVMQGGEDAVLKGNDPNPLEADSLFNAMIRLQLAMENEDFREMERATNLVEKAIDRITYARADIGIKTNSLDTLSDQLTAQEIQLTDAYNSARGIDVTDVTLTYQSMLLSYEACLKVTNQMFQMSLMNYL
ncbi:MAG: hypothetical protein LBQ54_01395 [Planctomycetaceae bacterium]|jgi:flagellin-like hook-associated protein FlgL|nr:hypothetical protein [Planctomycetaceae bacterium]